MRSGALTHQAGCDVQTVRFYEREVLLAEPEREPSGHRRYAQRHLGRLQFIRHCRSPDIPRPDIRELLGSAAAPNQACAEVNALLDQHIAEVHRRLNALTTLEKQLVALRKQCDGDTSRACVLPTSFMTASEQHACACHPS